MIEKALSSIDANNRV